VYVAWQNSTAPQEIYLANVTSGVVNPETVFDLQTTTNISGTSSANSVTPKLAEDDEIVHVSWLESVSGVSRVYVASSSNSYTSVAVSPGSAATNHQIIADGVNVFTVWQDTLGGTTEEILFSNSTDSGVTFGTPIDLSQSSGDSIYFRMILQTFQMFFSHSQIVQS